MGESEQAASYAALGGEVHRGAICRYRARRVNELSDWAFANTRFLTALKVHSLKVRM